MNGKKRGISFTFLLIISYVFFIALAGLSLLILNLIASQVTMNMIKVPDYYAIINSPSLADGNYSKLEKYVNNGYLEVLDENANVIYKTDGVKKSNIYTLDKLEFIDSYGETNSEYYRAETVTCEDGSEQYVLTKFEEINTTIDEESEADSAEMEYITNPIGVIILNSDYEIQYSSVALENDILTKDEISYILDSSENRDNVIKYKFNDKDNNQRYILIHSNPPSGRTWNRVQTAYNLVNPVFVIVIIGLIIVFALFMTRRVSKPIALLTNGMEKFADGNMNERISYRGNKEFEQICDTFNGMAEKLKEAENAKVKMEEDKRQMLADISHDLKTPITVIQGYSRAVADNVVPSDKRQSYLNAIVLKADQLADLINQFFEYSKLDHPLFTLSKEQDDICEYFREYLAFKYEEISLKGYEMDINIPDEKIITSFDKMQLKRVFENIINNTLKHNSSGTCIYVSLNASADMDRIAIRIGDNGVGIPKELRERIFEPFSVGNESRTSGQGTGLGMTIAKKIVEAHGGTISLIDNAEIKTLYEITLPV
ncbi:MAG: HAMP domain-containing histidine kinase [Butyrivibrio sp.]|nr:HAMP domain-containing histidine kinase [Butyrivibrio sp.]